MTVRISKPEFNLREKLTELDYDRVPYEKMPAGSIIQVVDHKANNSPTTTSSTYAEITGTSFDIYPKFHTSKIFVSWDFGTEANGALHGIAFRVYRQIDDGSSTLLKTQDQFTYNAQSGWNNGAGGVNITYIDTPNSIGKLTYYLQWHVEQSGTFYINYNDGGSAAKDGIAAQAMEIRQ
tara:strand:+ start:63 stop:599 length:537 start_codon:yes stop_codon:yes gene_type:complete